MRKRPCGSPRLLGQRSSGRPYNVHDSRSALTKTGVQKDARRSLQVPAFAALQLNKCNECDIASYSMRGGLSSTTRARFRQERDWSTPGGAFGTLENDQASKSTGYIRHLNQYGHVGCSRKWVACSWGSRWSEDHLKNGQNFRRIVEFQGASKLNFEFEGRRVGEDHDSLRFCNMWWAHMDARFLG
jgi:hypothetical protein